MTNAEVLRRSDVTGMEALLIKSQLRWCGHVCRMDDCRLPKTVFYLELSTGKRHHQHLRYKDVLKRHLKACDIPLKGWEDLASMRPEWRHNVKKVAASFEEARLKHLDYKRHLRQTRPKPSYQYTYNDQGQLYCAQCDRTFKTKFGFASHLRAH